MPTLKIYTNAPAGENYPLSLSGSIHFAFQEESSTYQELNSGYGILFAQATIREDNTIDARTLRNPRIYQSGQSYLIFADECREDGTPILDENVILFRTSDFITFESQQKVPAVDYENELAQSTDEITLSPETLASVKERWLPQHSEEAEAPIFPMAIGFADPVVFQQDGYWYFLATNDNVDDVGLFIRRAASVKGLFEKDVEMKCILDYDEHRELMQTFWAPEFHRIGEDYYILFAVSGKTWAPQCHMMKLKRGGDIMRSEDWEDPVRVRKMDGSYLTEDGISLDMTYFKIENVSYLVWSYRFGIGTPADTGSMLYIATTDEKKPWILTSEPVLLSRPLFGWENTTGTINNEGPYPLLLEDRIYLAYSGGAACGYSYAIGYLSASLRDNLLQPESWYKEPSPVLCSTFIEGIDGPGHNSFFYDEKGRLMVAYHAQETKQYHKRCTTMHPVHIGKNGFPFLNVTPVSDH